MRPFVYHDLGNMATIGRAAAVADFGWLRLHGLIGWIAWLFVHIFNLIGFRNRLLVMIQWAWAYTTLPAFGPPHHGSDRRAPMNGPARLGVVAFAIAAAMLPVPDTLVERWYSNGLYLRLQPVLTTVSNAVPFAFFDVLCVTALIVAVLFVTRQVRKAGWRRGLASVGGRLLMSAAVVYIVFLATWGLNYRRVPLRDKLRFDAARLNPSATNDLAMRVASEMNRLYMDAHGERFSIDSLASAFQGAETVRCTSPAPSCSGVPSRRSSAGTSTTRRSRA